MRLRDEPRIQVGRAAHVFQDGGLQLGKRRQVNLGVATQDDDGQDHTLEDLQQALGGGPVGDAARLAGVQSGQGALPGLQTLAHLVFDQGQAPCAQGE